MVAAGIGQVWGMLLNHHLDGPWAAGGDRRPPRGLESDQCGALAADKTQHRVCLSGTARRLVARLAMQERRHPFRQFLADIDV